MCVDIPPHLDIENTIHMEWYSLFHEERDRDREENEERDRERVEE